MVADNAFFYFSILAGVAELANEHLGNPMIYDLVEVHMRDILIGPC